MLVARVGHPQTRAKVSKAGLATLRHVDVEVAPCRGSCPLAASYAKLGLARNVAVVVHTFSAAASIVAATATSRRCRPASSTCSARAWHCVSSPRRFRLSRAWLTRRCCST